MEQLMIFSETNIYILSKLVALVRRDSGKRHRLNSETAIYGLLEDASLSSDERVQNYFTRFLDNLTPEQVLSYRNQGLSVPDQCMRKPSLFPKAMGQQYSYIARS